MIWDLYILSPKETRTKKVWKGNSENESGYTAEGGNEG